MTLSFPHATAMDHLMPMHVVFGPTGHIQHCGPTLQKLTADAPILGARLMEVFEVCRPRNVTSIADLLGATGMKLHLRFRDGKNTEFKAVVAPNAQSEGGILNLSFGIGVVEAVADYELTSADFAPNDLVIEMLYLVEAKSAAMEESRKLNQRLQSARVIAEKEAQSDGLTGLLNRRALDQVLDRFLDLDLPFTMMHLDLDFFKAVNDTLGHAAGDFVLGQVATILNEETRSDDIVARTGGDEFVLLLRKCTPDDKLAEIAKRIIQRLEVPLDFNGAVCNISGSIGTIKTDFYAVPVAEQMLADADAALYMSKRRGRGCHTAFQDIKKYEADTPELDVSASR
ncbi:diguanylate cyclase domain-containing protein [Algirhabdus cladophorae]|uniref:diguanylate cyclase domain-containing protein n=1 Tax=Algirhabdus cladophorae TaxID=3377108 RepID=UPI003B848549